MERQEYESIEEFFTSLKKEFREEKRSRVKGGRIKEVGAGREDDGRVCTGVQKSSEREFGYEGRPLVEEFKRGMNGGIRRKLIEAENPPTSIEQW